MGSGLDRAGALNGLCAGAHKVCFQRILQEPGSPAFCLGAFPVEQCCPQALPALVVSRTGLGRSAQPETSCSGAGLGLGWGLREAAVAALGMLAGLSAACVCKRAVCVGRGPGAPQLAVPLASGEGVGVPASPRARLRGRGGYRWRPRGPGWNYQRPTPHVMGCSLSLGTPPGPLPEHFPGFASLPPHPLCSLVLLPRAPAYLAHLTTLPAPSPVENECRRSSSSSSSRLCTLSGDTEWGFVCLEGFPAGEGGTRERRLTPHPLVGLDLIFPEIGKDPSLALLNK